MYYGLDLIFLNYNLHNLVLLKINSFVYEHIILHRLWPSFGGGETVTKCLASELIKRGHSVYVLYFKEKRNMSDSVNVDDKVIQNLIPGVSFDENSSEFFVNQKEAKYVSQFLINYVKEKI